MSIITISRGSYSRGREVAEKVAAKLGYECVSRDILLAAAGEFNLPEVKLARALHDAPSILDRFTFGREKYIAYINAALLEHVRHDNVVYHGLAGHFFLNGVSHVLKVRIVSDLEDRIRLEMERENISRTDAQRVLKKNDEERKKWSLSLYGVDTADTSLYDLVIHIRRIMVEDAADLICQAARLKQFQSTLESRRLLDDLVMAARIKAKLVAQFPHIAVAASRGSVSVDIQDNPDRESSLVQSVSSLVREMEGVTEARINFHPTD